MATPLIETRNLNKYFNTPRGVLHAVDDVNITIEQGSTMGVVGESGCGKTTLGRTILRLIPATSGQVLYKGTDILSISEKELKKLRQKIQIVFQDPYSSLNPRMSVSQIIAEPLKVCKILSDKQSINHRVLELMDVVGLARRYVDTYPHELDGGRRQRIGIARALAVDPEFIVCDEPVSALDVSIQAQILNLLMDLQEERGLSYMFITHDLSVVKHISKTITVLYLGKCVEICDSDELFTNPLHPYSKVLLDAIPIPDIDINMASREIVRGELTSPIDPPAGCRFASRCIYASEECFNAEVPLVEVEPKHFVACHNIKKVNK